ncbi:MAG TPA: glycosyltransferase [Gemmatimonadales bacterium]|nr:glycosyltransferase [Gemmatimonadales bacterium]
MTDATVRRVLIISHAYVDPAHRGKLRALAARDLDVTVGVPQRSLEVALNRTLEVGWERANGVEIFPVPVRRHRTPQAARFVTRALVSLLRDKRPDVLQVEEEPDTLMGQQVVHLARRLRLPVVQFTHCNVPLPLPLFARWRRRRTLHRLVGAVAGSEGAAALLRGEVPNLPVAVIPQLGVQVPPEPEHALHEGLAIGCVGRLVPEKGVDTLLQALAENRSARWHLTVVGDGPDRERLERLASELRLAARVRWTGALPPDELPKIWPELDVLVLPSRGLPTWAERSAHVLAEALANEVTVVGTSAGATPEVIGDAGVVVPPDDPGALAGALRRLTTADARRPFVALGRARAMQLFSDDAVAERTLGFWREVLSGA